MGEWQLHDATGVVVRAELTEDQAHGLVDWNHTSGNIGVYATGPNGQRYPEA